MLELYVDADGCPVKDEVYRVADRYGLRVWVVANAWLRVPEGPLVTRVSVSEGQERPDRPGFRCHPRHGRGRRPHSNHARSPSLTRASVRAEARGLRSRGSCGACVSGRGA
jgi:hypothetical protein